NAIGLSFGLVGLRKALASLIAELQDMRQGSAQVVVNLAGDLGALCVESVDLLQAMDLADLTRAPTDSERGQGHDETARPNVEPPRFIEKGHQMEWNDSSVLGPDAVVVASHHFELIAA